MNIIESITIKNFRSIQKITLPLNSSALNVIVGMNDSGKSNLLKALNLFFNNETEYNTKFRFEDDFCKFTSSKGHHAPEIEITLALNLPKHYRKNGLVYWTKKWRKSGKTDNDKITDSQGKEFDFEGGKGRAWLNKIRYFYVPAIRDEKYFVYLMRQMYDALNEVDSGALARSSDSLIGGIKEHIQSLVDEIGSRLNLRSSIAIPSDFEQLFATLDFEINGNNQKISLLKHGDGIKAQHIPLILRFIAQTLHKQKGKQVNSDIIWGFEEPENNLELSKTFDIAEIFKIYSQDIQIFINTHSPAFYLIAKNNTKVNLFWAEKEDSGTTTFRTQTDNDIESIDKHIGLLPLVSDYVKEEHEKIEALKSKISTLTQHQKKIIIYSEDDNLEYINQLLLNNNIKKDDFYLDSYKGRDNLKKILYACEKMTFDSSTVKYVVFHRDRDTFNDDEPDKEFVEKSLKSLNEKKAPVKFLLFKTKGYDVESYFLSKEHIKECCEMMKSSISLEKIETLLEEATKEAEKESLTKMYHNPRYTECKSDFFKPKKGKSEIETFEQISKEYQANTMRYRYGKKVLGCLIGKLQTVIKKRPNILQKTAHTKDTFFESLK